MELHICSVGGVGASLVEGNVPIVRLHLILFKAESHTRVCSSTERYEISNL